MKDLRSILEISARHHDHLCPRQILGARIGLAGLAALGFGAPPTDKRLLVILETDGCFADGVMAATDCAVGHRTLRVEDYGKTAVTFVDTLTRRAVRIAPAVDAREQAHGCLPHESRHYVAQLQAYQTIPDEELLTLVDVQLNTPVDEIVSRPGLRTNCALCGEEIMNGREIEQDGMTVCRACAGMAYYRRVSEPAPARLRVRHSQVRARLLGAEGTHAA